MEALAEAQRQYMVEKRKEQQKKEMAAREQECDNPKKPEMKDSRVYFGNKNAPITVVEYSDFQCGYCARSIGTMKQLLAAYPDKVRILYKHKAMFPGSDKAAAYYEAIGMQDPKKAWKFHDMVFEKRGEIKSGEKFLKKLAEDMDIDMDKLKEDMGSAEAIVKADGEEATKFQFDGTPGFLVGGVSVPGAQPFSEFKKIIEDCHLSNSKEGGAKEKKAKDKDQADEEKK